MVKDEEIVDCGGEGCWPRVDVRCRLLGKLTRGLGEVGNHMRTQRKDPRDVTYTETVMDGKIDDGRGVG